MDRIIELRNLGHPAQAGPDDSDTAASLPPAQPLPPTRARRSSDHRQRRPRALRVDDASAVLYRRSPPLIALLEQDALDPALTRRVA